MGMEASPLLLGMFLVLKLGLLWRAGLPMRCWATCRILAVCHELKKTLSLPREPT